MTLSAYIIHNNSLITYFQRVKLNVYGRLAICLWNFLVALINLPRLGILTPLHHPLIIFTASFFKKCTPLIWLPVLWPLGAISSCHVEFFLSSEKHKATKHTDRESPRLDFSLFLLSYSPICNTWWFRSPGEPLRQMQCKVVCRGPVVVYMTGSFIFNQPTSTSAAFVFPHGSITERVLGLSQQGLQAYWVWGKVKASACVGEFTEGGKLVVWK